MGLPEENKAFSYTRQSFPPRVYISYENISLSQPCTTEYRTTYCLNWVIMISNAA